ncbi:ubiquitin-conjugating enzyme E2 R2 [Vombatus ursinus]|uniref:ubiquitin-conjugating enzyme E2 R2 n=1 Tax=Vombatus ursinus TaxID=29139 RepID=UPI000FFD24E7|nr:ubiquitin-conjugating enzyme E2 R2 [Vombatus ursinus]
MAQQQMTSSQKALMLELKSLQEEPVEGFRITLVDESDLYNWEVAIFGPPNTLYEGGYFKVLLQSLWPGHFFSEALPGLVGLLSSSGFTPWASFKPRYLSNININFMNNYDCSFFHISRTILLSVISLLNEPNTFSPANVDASVMFRKWRDSKGKDKEYAEIIRKQVLATKAEAEKDGVKVPTTLAEYCIKTKVPSNDNSSDLLYDDLYDDDIDDEDEEEEDADCYDDDDSGNEES